MNQILKNLFAIRLLNSWEEFYDTNPYEVSILDKRTDTELLIQNNNVFISNCYFQVLKEVSSYGGALRIVFQSEESLILIEFTILNKWHCLGLGGGSLFVSGGDKCVLNKCCSYGSSVSYPFIDETVYTNNILSPHSSFCLIYLSNKNSHQIQIVDSSVVHSTYSISASQSAITLNSFFVVINNLNYSYNVPTFWITAIEQYTIDLSSFENCSLDTEHDLICIAYKEDDDYPNYINNTNKFL